MRFNNYQAEATKTATYPDIGNNILYPAMGLAGEAGETLDKIKKYWRNKGITRNDQLSHEDKHALLLEIGDVLWYCAALATELQTELEVIAELNLEKLNSRKSRGMIKSEGDNR